VNHIVVVGVDGHVVRMLAMVGDELVELAPGADAVVLFDAVGKRYSDVHLLIVELREAPPKFSEVAQSWQLRLPLTYFTTGPGANRVYHLVHAVSAGPDYPPKIIRVTGPSY